MIECSRANIEMKPAKFDGDVNLDIKPKIVDDGVELNVQLVGHATASQEIIVGGKTLEVKAHGDGRIAGKWHCVFKEKN